MAVKSIILDCISEVSDENGILDCLKLDGSTTEELAENIQNVLISSLTYTSSEYSLIFNGNLKRIMDFLQIFGCYLNGMTKVVLNCKRIGLHLNTQFMANSKFVDNQLDFMRNLSAIGSSANISLREDWCIIKTNFAAKLFSFTFDICEPEAFIDVMKRAQGNNPGIKVLYDKCVTMKLIQLLIAKPVRKTTKKVEETENRISSNFSNLCS